MKKRFLHSGEDEMPYSDFESRNCFASHLNNLLKPF